MKIEGNGFMKNNNGPELSPSLDTQKNTQEVTKRETPENVRDEELVRRFNSGDESAFKEIVALYRERLINVANTFLHDYHASEDVVQECLVSIHNALPKFRGDSALFSWMYDIVANRSRNLIGFRFRRRHLAGSIDAPIELQVPDTNSPLPSKELEDKERAGRITTAMEKLSAKYRDILRLAAKNIHYDEMAKILGIGIGTVKSRLRRARESLRALLPDDFPEYSDPEVMYKRKFEENEKSREAYARKHKKG